MKKWLQERTREALELSDALEGHLMGRGIKYKTIKDLFLGEWGRDRDDAETAPDPVFRERYGRKGKPLAGSLVCPLFSPRGYLIGAEFRAWQGPKALSRYLLPEAAWNPILVGFPKAMSKIWDGGDVWVGEGIFDMCALEHVVPPQDALVATVRAKLTNKHVEFLRRHVRGTVYMVYDRDETGRRATKGWVDDTGKRRWGALDVLNRVGVSCRDVPYIGGKDPGEIWERSGTEGLRDAFGGIF